MDGLFLEVVAAMLFTNMLTACVIYGVWRTRKNESDLAGLSFVIAPCLLGALIVFAVM